MDTYEEKPTLPFKPSSLETIDYALFEWLNDTMNINCTTNDGWKKVPVTWVAGERSGQRANQIRARSGAIAFPIITIERTGVSKDPTFKGVYYGNLDPISFPKGGSVKIARRIKQSKTANFLNADAARRFGANGVVGNQKHFPNEKENRKIVYEILTVPMPVYLNLTYTINIQTEYQQQMNEIATPFATKTGGINYFIAEKDGYAYECFIQPDFAQQNNVSNLAEDRRQFITTITIKTLGYVIGAGQNQETPNIAIRENAVEYKTPREHVIFGDETPWLRGKYRS
jgi:hypothetical protein